MQPPAEPLLSYQLLWGPPRSPVAVALVLQPAPLPQALDGLVRWLGQHWPAEAPLPLLLAVDPSDTLPLLDATRNLRGLPVVPDAALRDAAVVRAVHEAQQAGRPLAWRGAPGARPPQALAHCFARCLLGLTVAEALAGLQASRRREATPTPSGIRGPSRRSVASPVWRAQIYEGVPGRALLRHCLDEQGVWAVAGWPAEELLDSSRQHLIGPDRQGLLGLIESIEAGDPEPDWLAHLSADPVLAYRLLRYVNSLGLGLRMPVSSLERAVEVLGAATLRAWLLDQLPRASDDADLRPVRTALALRGRLMRALCAPGPLAETAQLCGLLSAMDLILGDPLTHALARLPLPAALTEALLQRSGPLYPAYTLACALESTDNARLRPLLRQLGFQLPHVTEALLGTLALLRPHTQRSLLLV